MAQSHPPKPRLTLRIGITGKRALPVAQWDDIQAALDHVIDALADLLARCQSEQRDVWAEAPPLLRIVSGLAEGADQMGAQLMLAKPNRVTPGGRVETRVAAILPFPPRSFWRTFAPTQTQAPLGVPTRTSKSRSGSNDCCAKPARTRSSKSMMR